jgi:hypothetical protein
VANKNIIVLNGKHYDPATGVVVANTAKKLSSSSQPRLVDSFVRSGAPLPHSSKTKPIAKPRKPMRLAAKSISQKPQSAQTLMRHVVKKPSGLAGPVIKAHISTDSGEAIIVHTSAISLHKASTHTVDVNRMERAQQVQKASAIRRFTASDHASYTVPSPAISVVPKSPALFGAPARPTGIASVQPTSPSKQLFEKALADSRSHEQEYTGPLSTKSRRRQHVSIAGLVIVGVAMAAFVVYLNVPNLTMSVASARAGFHATIPGYLPSGYSTKRVDYSTGTVTTQYQSNSDSRHFSIVQKESDWDSSALVTNYITASNQDYQTYQIDGRSVYITGNGDATWVDGGVWFMVQSDSNLPVRQLLDIARGL